MEICVTSLTEEVTCPLCGPAGRRHVADKPPHRIVRCMGCGICYASPRARREAMESFYERYFASDPETDYEHYRAGNGWRAAVAAGRLKTLSRFVRPGRLLDHGCATGIFLEQAARVGWEVCGVEPSSAARAVITRNAPYVKLLSAEDLKDLSGGMFDAITMFDNFCYLDDPLGALRRFRSLLRPGGVIFSIGALDHTKAHKIPEPGITHTFYYSPRSVEALCRSAGLRLLLNTTIVKNANNPGKHPLAWLLGGVPGLRNLFFRQHCFAATALKEG